MSPSTDSEWVIPYDRFNPKMIIGIILGYCVMAFMAINESNVFIKGMGFIGFILLGVIFVSHIFRSFDSKPALVISRKGIFDGSPLTAFGWIRWEEVRSMDLYSMYDQKMIGFNIENVEQNLHELGLVKRILISLNMRSGFPPVNITQVTVKEPLEKIFEDIKKSGFFHGDCGNYLLHAKPSKTSFKSIGMAFLVGIVFFLLLFSALIIPELFDLKLTHEFLFVDIFFVFGIAIVLMNWYFPYVPHKRFSWGYFFSSLAVFMMLIVSMYFIVANIFHFDSGDIKPFIAVPILVWFKVDGYLKVEFLKKTTSVK